MSIDFETFVQRLTQRLKEPLPGPIAHEPMRATPLGSVRPDFKHSLPPKPGAVLILLYREGDKIKFPLTQRAEYVGAHSGQISLPGGKGEKGENAIQTALREGTEEIGIDMTEVEVIGQLSNFFVIPSNFMVTPVIAVQRTKPSFTPDPVEVAGILNGNVDDLIAEDAIQDEEILVANVYRMQAPHFLIENKIVWGATAMMLNEFRTIIREIR